jgi:hypothetical protein
VESNDSQPVTFLSGIGSSKFKRHRQLSEHYATQVARRSSYDRE